MAVIGFFLATTGPAAKALETSIVIEGDLPEKIYGRWILVTTLRPSAERAVNIASILEIVREQEGEQVSVDLWSVALPRSEKSGMEEADKANLAWEPSKEILSKLRENPSLFPNRNAPHFSRVEYRIVTREKYDEAIRSDKLAEGTRLVVTVSRFFTQKEGQRAPVRSHHVYYVSKVEPRVIEGRYSGLQLLAAPFPVPVPLKGSFKAYRLEIPPKGPDEAPSNAAEETPAAE